MSHNAIPLNSERLKSFVYMWSRSNFVLTEILVGLLMQHLTD